MWWVMEMRGGGEEIMELRRMGQRRRTYGDKEGGDEERLWSRRRRRRVEVTEMRKGYEDGRKEELRRDYGNEMERLWR